MTDTPLDRARTKIATLLADPYDDRLIMDRIEWAVVMEAIKVPSPAIEPVVGPDILLAYTLRGIASAMIAKDSGNSAIAKGWHGAADYIEGSKLATQTHDEAVDAAAEALWKAIGYDTTNGEEWSWARVNAPVGDPAAENKRTRLLPYVRSVRRYAEVAVSTYLQGAGIAGVTPILREKIASMRIAGTSQTSAESYSADGYNSAITDVLALIDKEGDDTTAHDLNEARSFIRNLASTDGAPEWLTMACNAFMKATG